MSNNENTAKPKTWQLVQDIKNMELEIDARKQIERVLKSREDRFKTIFFHAPVAYFLIDSNGNFIDGNLASYQLTGYTTDELFGGNFIELKLIDKKDQKAISKIMLRSAQGEYTGPDEFSMRKKDGSFASIEIMTSPVTISDKKLILGAAQDVTERNKSKTKLQASEERFRKLFDSAHDAFMTLNPPTWKFTSGNPAILNMFKLKSIKEFLTYSPWNLSPEKQPDGRLSSEKAKEMIEMAMAKGSNYFEWTHKRITGELFLTKVLLTRIQLKDEIFLQATIKDVTEQKLAEEVKNVLINISNSANVTQNLDELYSSIHNLLAKIIDVSNFYIALVDIKNHTLHFPYHADTTDDDFLSISNFNTDDSLTGLVVSKRKPLLLKKEELENRVAQKGVWGPTPLIWMGVPLIIKNEIIGVIAIQSYVDPNLYTMQDLEILSAVSDQVAIAIDRKRSEDALREGEEKYRTLVENANDGITIIQDNKVVFINKFLADLYGKPVNDIIGRSFTDFIHPESMELILERHKKRIAGKKVPSKYRAALTNVKKGKVFCELKVTTTSFKNKPAEQIIVHDITDDISKEEQLVKSEKKYRDLFEKSKDAVLIINNGKFVDCNKATINMLRYKNKKEFLNTHPSKLSPEKQPDGKLSYEKADEMMNTAYKNGSHRFEWDHKRSDGEIFPVEVLLTAISVDEDNKILHTVWRDITNRKKADRELKQSEERFKRLFDDLGDAVFVTKLGGANRGQILEVNRAAEIQTGYNRKELLKMNIIKDLYISGSGEIKADDWEEKLGKGETVKTIEKKRKKDGTEFWTEVIVTSILYKGKNAGLSINHDITERKQKEKDIQKNAIQRGKLLDFARELSSSLDLEFILSEVNQQLLELLDSKGATIYLLDSEKQFLIPVASRDPGYEKEVLSNKVNVKSSLGGKIVKSKKGMIFNNASQIPGAYQIPGTSEDENEHLMILPLLKRKEIFGTLNVYRKEKIYLKEDLELAETFASHASTAIQNAQANQSLVHEIDERKRGELALQENEEKFRSIVYNSPSVIMQADKQGTISFINYKYSGREPEEIIGKSIYELIPPEYSDAAKTTINNVFVTGDSYSFESIGHAIGKDAVWYKNTVSAIRKNDKVVGVALLATDITEQKQIDIMKTEFISSVSHELRTPLTIIRESLSLLSDGLFGELNKEQAEIVNPAMDDVDRLGRIINNLLDISKMEGQKIKIEREIVDIVKLARGVVKSFENQIASKNIELVLTSNQEAINLYLDRDRIIQVLMNLIGNAVKFTKEGKIEVIITDKENTVECCIADTGKGINTKDLGTIFDRFHQVGKVVRAAEKGSGLGLSISKGIVKLHRGKIWVNSKVDKGSKFYFSLPKYSPDEIIIENIDKGIDAAAKKHIKLSLLLVKVDNLSEIDKIYKNGKESKIINDILRTFQDTLAPGEFSFINSKNEIVLFSDITSQNISIIGSKLEDMLEKSLAKAGIEIEIELSSGYSIYPSDAANSFDLIEAARKNMKKQ